MLFSSRHLWFFLFIVYLSTYTSWAQVGAPTEGSGNATSTTTTVWSSWHNPAGIVSVPNFSVAVSHRLFQDINGLSTSAFAVAYPIDIGSFGLGISKFGDALYNQHQVNLSYGNKLGITELGIRLSYYQYQYEGFGKKGLAIVSFGGITQMSKRIKVGAFVENITQAKLSNLQDERIPTIMQVGVAYQPIHSINIKIDVRKDIEHDTSLLFGLAYNIIERFTILTGFNTTPARQFFGLEFAPHNINVKISYSLAHQRTLGIAHQLSLQYDFKKSE